MYRLTIDHLVENPHYEEEKKKWDAELRYNQPLPMCGAGPAHLISERSLTVDLTDLEFAAIKKAVLEVM